MVTLKNINTGEIENLYVEHKTNNVLVNCPHYLVNSPSKKIEKLFNLLVIEDPRETVDDGIAYIKHMLNMSIPREKIEDAMDMAKENVIQWNYRCNTTSNILVILKLFFD
ncbi:unnamed protein product [Lactuca saligna]|uniref:Uncharacterized protein n=1 Tax=Lactuca saligna TaxID=75948 RepID=A0AA35YKA5_LACSI|nr:unnamed protein product [Lactuca saligna]